MVGSFAISKVYAESKCVPRLSDFNLRPYPQTGCKIAADCTKRGIYPTELGKHRPAEFSATLRGFWRAAVIAA
jgi:hypothetical protein